MHLLARKSLRRLLHPEMAPFCREQLDNRTRESLTSQE